MVDILFYVFATTMLVSALAVILNKNAVNSAMCMIVTLVSTAGLFFLLEAYFIAVLQILVYAGAVMVLFLFIIMLLDVDKGENIFLKKNNIGIISAILGISILTILALFSFSAQNIPNVDLVTISQGDEFNVNKFDNTIKSFGQILFTKYMLPFQIIGFLLLLSMIGVIVISKKPKF